jgi:hypothetical protein
MFPPPDADSSPAKKARYRKQPSTMKRYWDGHSMLKKKKEGGRDRRNWFALEEN